MTGVARVRYYTRHPMRNHLLLALGLAAGLALGLSASYTQHPALLWMTGAVRPFGTVFLNLLSMVVIPLVATALFSGIAGLGRLGRLGRLGARMFGYYWGTQALGIVAGFALAALILPLAPMTPEHQAILRGLATDSTSVSGALARVPTGMRVLVDMVPGNPVKAAADGALLPLVVFTALFALATGALAEEKRRILIDLADAGTQALTRIVRWVLVLAPVGILGLVAPAVAQSGWSLVKAMLVFSLVVIVGCGLMLLLHLAAVRIFAGLGPRRFLKAVAPSMLMGFSTASSAAALPPLFDAAERDLHISHGLAGLVLPTGTTLHRAGSSLYQAAAVLFIGQLFGVPFGAAALVQAGVAVFLASLTVAPVPSGSVLSLAPAFSATGLPLAGLPLLIAIDRIPDMVRTATNVAGHLTAATIVATGEGESVG